VVLIKIFVRNRGCVGCETFNGLCDKFHEFESKMLHAAEHQLTYIRTLDEATRQNRKDIVNLARTLRDSIRNYSLSLVRVEVDLLDTQAALKKQIRYSAAIREIEMAIIQLKFSIIQLQEVN
jgi:hypothetical protein